MADEAEAKPARVSSMSARQIAKIGATVEHWKTKAKASQTDLEKARKRIEELEKVSTPEAVQKELQEKTAKLAVLSHRKVFDRVAAELKANPDALDDLYLATGHKAEGEPDEAKIRELVSGLKASKGWYFTEAKAEGGKAEDGKAEGEAQARAKTLPATPPPGSGKGGRASDAGGPSVTRAQLADPVWMFHNQAAAAEACKAGRVHD